MVPGGEGKAPASGAPGNAGTASGGGGGLADALAAALSQRNKKVSASGTYRRCIFGFYRKANVSPQTMRMRMMIGMTLQNVDRL